MKPKKELIRVVHNAEGITSLDTTGRAHGRGAYVCKSKECFEKAKKTSAFNRAFQANIPQDIYENLSKELGVDE